MVSFWLSCSLEQVSYALRHGRKKAVCLPCSRRRGGGARTALLMVSFWLSCSPE